MQKNLKFWHEKLSTNELKKILATINAGKEIDLLVDDIEIDGKKYSIDLKTINNNKHLNLECSDGRKLSIWVNLKSLNANKNDHVDYNLQKYGGFNIIYKNKKNELKWNTDYLGSYSNNEYEDIDNLKLINNLTFGLSDNRCIKHIADNFFNYFIFCDVYGFNNFYYINEFGIHEIYRDDIYIVSSDLQRVMYYNLKEVPDYKTLKDFNLNEHILEIQKLIQNESDCREEIFSECLDIFNKEKEIKFKVWSYYKDRLPMCREAVREYLKSLEDVNNFIFTKDELLKLSEIFSYALDKKEYIVDKKGKEKILRK